MRHRHAQCEHKQGTHTLPQSPGLHIQHFLVSSNIVLNGASMYPWWECSLETLPLGPSPLYPAVRPSGRKETSVSNTFLLRDFLYLPSWGGNHTSPKRSRLSPQVQLSSGGIMSLGIFRQESIAGRTLSGVTSHKDLPLEIPWPYSRTEPHFSHD